MVLCGVLGGVVWCFEGVLCGVLGGVLGGWVFGGGGWG